MGSTIEDYKKYIEKYKNNPIEFIEEVLGMKLNVAQKALMMLYIKSYNGRPVSSGFPNKKSNFKNTAWLVSKFMNDEANIFSSDGGCIYFLPKPNKDKPIKIVMVDE